MIGNSWDLYLKEEYNKDYSALRYSSMYCDGHHSGVSQKKG